jgi:type IV secretion system protein VirD4
MTNHAYYPWTAWMLTAQHVSLIAIAAGLSSLIGLGMTVKIARDNGSFSRFGGPAATGHGEHGTAHWRPMSGIGGVQEGFALWLPPKPAKPPKPQPESLPRPNAELMLPPNPSVVAAKIAEDYHRGIEPPPNPKARRPPEPYRPSGLMVGLAAQKPSQGAWTLARDEHAVIIGSPGSGKTRRLLLPTIGIVGATRKESLIISDVKGELYQHSAKYLEAQGYTVNRIDLRQHPNPNHQHFNPIAAVRTALMAGDWSVGTSSAQSIAHILVHAVPGAENAKDPFWPETETSVLTAMILALAEHAADEQAHLYSLFVSLAESLGTKNLDAWFRDPDRYPPGHAAALAYSVLSAAGEAEQTKASILAGALAAVRLFGLPEIAELTAFDDHDLADAGRKLTATFLVVPWHDASRNSIVGLYLALTIQALAECAERHTGRLPVPVLFLLDEFGNFPAIPNFSTLITTARSQGMRFIMAVQALEQFGSKYPGASETITGSSNTWIFLRSQGEKTPTTISKMLGEYTLSKASTTSPKIDFFSSTVPGSATESNQLAGRSLATPDEILRWPLGTALVIQGGFAPAKLPLPDLSAWSGIFPDLQMPHPDPDPADTNPPSPPLWSLAAALELDESGEASATPTKTTKTARGMDGLFRA